MFRWFARALVKYWTHRRPTAPIRRRALLHLEALETRWVPAVISGYAYNDLNNDGMREATEPAIANSLIELRDSSGNFIDSTFTNGVGYYEFTKDPRINPNPQTQVQELFLNDPTADTSISDFIAAFDPAKGTLNRVEIINDATLTSTIEVENKQLNSGATITARVTGTMTLTVGNQSLVSTLDSSQPPNVPISHTVGAYDGFLDYAGTSGYNFGPIPINHVDSLNLYAGIDNLNAFEGSQPIKASELSFAQSAGTGSGTLAQFISSSSMGHVTVRYYYTPSTDLRPGKYEVDQPKVPDTYLPNKGYTNTIVVDTTSGDSSNNNFGAIKLAGLTGYVYADNNNDGVKDPSEAGIVGATIKLSWINAAGQPVSTTTTTDASGFYAFEDLTPGTYTLTELAVPAGYLDGKDTLGTPGNLPGNGAIAGNDVFTNIRLSSGDEGENNNFGEIKATGLSGFVYSDPDNDGFKSPSEQGLSGVSIVLSRLNASGQYVTVTQQTTGANGFYSFTNLAPGTYAIRKLNDPAGYFDGKDTIGTQSGTTSTNLFSNIQLNAGDFGTDNDFGELQAARLGGYVYHDKSNDGIKQGGEEGLAGVVIQLRGTTFDGNSITVNTTTTSAGRYDFTNVKPGTYSLRELSQPVGFLDGKDTIGTQGGVQGNDIFSQINLMAGVNGNLNDFGEFKPGSLSGYTWIDKNNDGIKQSSEASLAGVKVTLIRVDSNGNQIGSAIVKTTDLMGFYSFTGLGPGDYVIVKTPKSGYLDGKQSLGSLGGAQAPDEFFVVLGAEKNGVNYNFGHIPPPPKTPPKVVKPPPSDQTGKYWAVFFT